MTVENDDDIWRKRIKDRVTDNEEGVTKLKTISNEQGRKRENNFSRVYMPGKKG